MNLIRLGYFQHSENPRRRHRPVNPFGPATNQRQAMRKIITILAMVMMKGNGNHRRNGMICAGRNGTYCLSFTIVEQFPLFCSIEPLLFSVEALFYLDVIFEILMCIHSVYLYTSVELYTTGTK
jgi:hypothetical protein